VEEEMNKRLINTAAAFAAACAMFPGTAGSVNHEAKTVALIGSPDDRPCLFFMLRDGAEADAVVPGNSWFAVPKTHNGYKEIVSILITAHLSGKVVNVYTTGAVAAGCSQAEVRAVSF
jgi:hypothetical protein